MPHWKVMFRRSRALGTLKRMEEVAKVIGDLPPPDDQGEGEAELLRKVEAEQRDEAQQTKEGSEDERDRSERRRHQGGEKGLFRAGRRVLGVRVRGAMAIEFRKNKVPYFVQYNVEVFYEGESVGTQRLDFVIDGKIAVELKSARKIAPANLAQTRAYLRTTNFALAVIVNFPNEPEIKDEPEIEVIEAESDAVPLKVAEAGAKKTDGPGVSGAGG